MLDIIKDALFKSGKYKDTDNKGIFCSLFDKNNVLLTSNGVLESDKTLGQTVDLIYHGILSKQPNVKYIVIDVVTESREETDIKNLTQLNLKERGVCLVNNTNKKSGVLLPNTEKVNDLKTALTVIKQKYNLGGNVAIFVFKTERIVVSL